MNDFFSLVIKGGIIGIANIIPGVSGGTMAFVLGIYQQLSEAIGYFLICPEKRKEYILFLGHLFIGVVAGFLLFAKLISFLLGIDLPEGAPVPFSYVPTFAFFLGLIIGSVPVLIKMQSDVKITPVRILLLVMGFTMLFLVASLKEGSSHIEQTVLIKDFSLFKVESQSFERSLWLLFIGMLAATTMVIPGISGSALLVALGEYGNILNAISERSIMPLSVFGLGVIIGIIVTTLLMAKLLENRAGATFFFILGLIAASCVQVVMQMVSAQASVSAWLISIPILMTGIYVATLSAKLKPTE